MREGGRECEPKEGNQGMFFINLKVGSCSGCVDGGGVRGRGCVEKTCVLLCLDVSGLYLHGGCVAEM